MVGLIEHQQGILHSNLVEKIQQVKQEHLNVYQQQAAAELQQKNVQQQHQVPGSDSSAGIRVDEKGEKQRERRRKKDRERRPEDGTAQSPDHLLDVVA